MRYELDDEKFIKDEVTFGESWEYFIKCKDEEDEFIFPLIFRVLKKLYNKG